MDPSAGLKSILKKTTPTLPIARSDAQQRRLASAIEQAQRLEDEKDAARKNLAAIEELSDLDPSSRQDAADHFLSLVSTFYPSDYDGLIEERNANQRCGYVLCPKRHVRSTHKMAVLRPSTQMPWCSNECGKRALYLRAQLDETPAWERRQRLTLRPDDVIINRVSQRDLALERGEADSIGTSRARRLVSTPVLDKPSTGRPAQAPVPNADRDNKIEGYRLTRTTYNMAKERDLNDILESIRL